jgi:hypothetical protein
MIARIRKSQVRYEYGNDREIAVVQGCNLFSGTILSSTNAYRLLIGSQRQFLVH